MSAQQTFMEERRHRTGKRNAKSKPFAVEVRWPSESNCNWQVWGRYERRGDAEQAAKSFPRRFVSINLQARVVGP